MCGAIPEEGAPHSHSLHSPHSPFILFSSPTSKFPNNHDTIHPHVAVPPHSKAPHTCLADLVFHLVRRGARQRLLHPLLLRQVLEKAGCGVVRHQPMAAGLHRRITSQECQPHGVLPAISKESDTVGGTLQMACHNRPRQHPKGQASHWGHHAHGQRGRLPQRTA